MSNGPLAMCGMGYRKLILWTINVIYICVISIWAPGANANMIAGKSIYIGQAFIWQLLQPAKQKKG